MWKETNICSFTKTVVYESWETMMCILIIMKVLAYNINSSQAELSGSFKAKQDSFIRLGYS